MSDTPETHYIKTPGGVYLAYQAVGEGPVDIAFDFHPDESNVDLMWDEPDWRPFLVEPVAFARVILHDRRGLGVSSRNVPPANLETRVSDFLTVLDVVHSERPILVAAGDTGAMFALFAATHPDRSLGAALEQPGRPAGMGSGLPVG